MHVRKQPFVRVVLACLLVATACTSGEDDAEGESLPSLRDAAVALVQAWEDRSAPELQDVALDPASVDRFLRWTRRAEGRARITSLEVGLGEVPQPSPPPAGSPSPGAPEGRVPYAITWTSEASTVPVRLEGVATFSLHDGRWKVPLERALLWPGIADAHGFEVEQHWPRRGTIRDRRGRPLARGRAEERAYPHGTLAGTTLGHMKSLTRSDLREEDVVGGVGDVVGGSGMEEAFDERLSGAPEASLHVVNRMGDVVRLLGSPVPGSRSKDVRSTLDIDVQRAAERAHGGVTGGAVVLDPRNGDLLAVVDSSTFGPGNYVGARDVHPFNRALSGLYPPGSAMKVVTAAAALDTDTVSPGTTVTGPKEYKGVRNFESGEFGRIPFSRAVQDSVNTAFAQVAEDLGAEQLHRYAERFGFNEEPRVPAGTSSFPFPEDLGDVMWSSVGQAQTLATPMQMASVAATIANRGKRMEPRLALHQPKRGKRAVSVETAVTMTSLMRSVVDGGTGTGAAVPGVSVAGKTGTAEVDTAGGRQNHAWFIAFAPANDPKVAVAVVAELGGVGGRVAAPLARSILQAVLPLVP